MAKKHTSSKTDDAWAKLVKLEIDPDPARARLVVAMMQADAHANFVAEAVKHIRRDIAKLQTHINAKCEDFDFPVELPARRRVVNAI